MAKTENVFVKAKAYQRLHPRTSWPECIQKVSGKRKVSGTKKVAGTAKVAGAKKRAKRPRVNTHPVASTRTGHKVVHSRIKRAESLMKEIDKLEARAKEVTNKDVKHVYYAEINSLHKKLDTLKRSV